MDQVKKKTDNKLNEEQVFQKDVTKGVFQARAYCGYYAFQIVSKLQEMPFLFFDVLDWFEDSSSYLGCDIDDDVFDELKKKSKNKSKRKKCINAALKALQVFQKDNSASVELEPIHTNMSLLAGPLGFNTLECELLTLRLACEDINPIDKLVDCIAETVSSIPKALAIILNAPKADIDACLSPSNNLYKTGMLRRDYSYQSSSFTSRYDVSGSIRKALISSFTSKDELERALFDYAKKSNLTISNYDHIAINRDLARDILKGALSTNTKGVNILFYGPPGTGKTELSKVIAENAGGQIISIGEESSDGEEQSRKERLSILKLANKLLGNRKNSIILFDEMEDVLEGEMNKKGSKIFLNKLLENNEVPTIWITNNIDKFDPALLRRFTTAFELGIPNIKTRQSMWTDMLDKCDIEVSKSEALGLARKHKIAPGLLSTAITATRLSGGNLNDFKTAVSNIKRVMNGGHSEKFEAETVNSFLPSLVNTDLSLDKLTNQLCSGSATKSFSLCLNGAAGTGKSLYARYLAEKMGLEVIQKRASDLKSMWVGETEKNIALAFEEARNEEAFLIFDEADSLLFDRREATAPWQVSQVNEMLTWMESHLFPFVCTTNLSEKLDPASLRRFTFKLEFKSLSTRNLRAAFQYFYGFDAPANLDSLDNLTVGDMAVVKKKAEILGALKDPKLLLEYLVAESETKGGKQYKVGF